VDEWTLGFLPEFDGTPLQSVAKGAVDLGKLQDEDEKKTMEAAQESAKPLLDSLKHVLQEKAEDVRVTTRLVDSAACLVSQEHGMSTQLARLLKQAGQSMPGIKPVLEINLDHPLIARLQAVQDDETRFADLAHVVFDQALLAEGGLPDDPAAYVRRVNALLA
jgi:molecular chaperone HtpG